MERIKYDFAGQEFYLQIHHSYDGDTSLDGKVFHGDYKEIGKMCYYMCNRYYGETNLPIPTKKEELPEDALWMGQDYEVVMKCPYCGHDIIMATRYYYKDFHNKWYVVATGYMWGICTYCGGV